MKFQVQKNVLQDALQSALSAVPNKSTLQILNNFALHLEGNFLEISATDLDLGIRVRIEVQGERDGSVVLNARKISDQIKSLVDPAITVLTFEVKNYLTTIQWSEKGRASITGFDAGDFPPFPEIDDGESFVLGKMELAFLAEKTLFATSSDTTRITLNGVYLENKNGKLTMVATDGHRLGRAYLELENFTAKLGVIVPPKAIQYALRSVPSDANIEIRVSSTHILFSSDNLQVISKLIEGPYPNYEGVIPRNFERTVQANTTDFLNKIRSVISMANARTRQIRLQLDGNLLDLSATDPNVGGDSCEELAVTHSGEGSFSIGFNGQYLSEILGMCSSEEVILKMNNPVGACIIEPVGDGADFSFLLMPLRLVDE
ncbi:MAG: DNA polymerase III subunit beta [Fibrobacter sp.]|jgi:DNA polymerase-3 subunit beta|nr:DNA polymerase III subunit beta [Fibrobacter sp.]